MSEASSRLNLIQRAMQRSAMSPGSATEPRAAATALREPVSAEVDVLSKESDSRPENIISDQIEIPHSVAPAVPDALPFISDASPVHLDYAKLNASCIITPENTGSSTYSEFRSLKRKLIPLTRAHEPGAAARNLVMISSALPGEGKTFTAMNLAIALAAESNLNVILVDGDLVHSSVTSYFHGENKDGLLELLIGKRERISDVLHPCADLPGLHVLFAGHHHTGVPELLASSRMVDICAALSQHFEQGVVLFDMPPVLAASEPASMAAHVDHLIMVVAAGKAARHQVEAALSEVSRCPSINLLFNRSPNWERPLSDSYSYYAYARGNSGG
jgi:protein-tyrosine kinase